jgi:hypothetical protein
VRRFLKITAVRADAAVCNNEALRLAAEQGYLDIVIRLLEIPAVKHSIAASHYWQLIYAVMDGHLDTVNQLLATREAKDSVSEWNNLALKLANKKGHVNIVDCLEEAMRPDGSMGGNPVVTQNDEAGVMPTSAHAERASAGLSARGFLADAQLNKSLKPLIVWPCRQ